MKINSALLVLGCLCSISSGAIPALAESPSVNLAIRHYASYPFVCYEGVVESDAGRELIEGQITKIYYGYTRASLEEFVMSEHPHVVRGLSNNMTTFLSADGTADAASALRTLQSNFVTFGIQEEFDESLRYMRQSWPRLGPYHRSRGKRLID